MAPSPVGMPPGSPLEPMVLPACCGSTATEPRRSGCSNPITPTILPSASALTDAARSEGLGRDVQGLLLLDLNRPGRSAARFADILLEGIVHRNQRRVRLSAVLRTEERRALQHATGNGLRLAVRANDDMRARRGPHMQPEIVDRQ